MASPRSIQTSRRWIVSAMATCVGVSIVWSILAIQRWMVPWTGEAIWTTLVPSVTCLLGLGVGTWIGGTLGDRGRPSTLLTCWFLVLGSCAWMGVSYLAAPDLLPRALPTLALCLALSAIWLLPISIALGCVLTVSMREALSRYELAGRALAAPLMGACIGAALASTLFRTFGIPQLSLPLYTFGPGMFAVAGLLLALALPDRGYVIRTRKHTGLWQAMPKRWWLCAFVLGLVSAIFLVVVRTKALRYAIGVRGDFHLLPMALGALAIGLLLSRWLADRTLPRKATARGFAILAAALLLPMWWALDQTPSLRRPLLTSAILAWPVAVCAGVLLVTIARAPLEDASEDGRRIAPSLAAWFLGLAVGLVFAYFGPGYLNTHGPLRIAIAFVALSAAVWAMPLRPVYAFAAPAALVALVGSTLYTPPGAQEWRSRHDDLQSGWTQTSIVHVDDHADFMAVRQSPALQGNLQCMYDPHRVAWKGPINAEQRLLLQRAATTAASRTAVAKLVERAGRWLLVLNASGHEQGVLNPDHETWTASPFDQLVLRMGQRGLIGVPSQRILVSADRFSTVAYPIAGTANQQRGNMKLIVLQPRRGYFESMQTLPGHRDGSPDIALVHDDLRPFLRMRPEEPKFGWVHVDTSKGRAARWHTVTREAAVDLRAAIEDQGFLTLVVRDAPREPKILARVVATLASEFAHVDVYSLSEPPSEDQLGRRPFVIWASSRPLKLGRQRDQEGHPLEIIKYGPSFHEALRQDAGDSLLLDSSAHFDE